MPAVVLKGSSYPRQGHLLVGGRISVDETAQYPRFIGFGSDGRHESPQEHLWLDRCLDSWIVRDALSSIEAAALHFGQGRALSAASGNVLFFHSRWRL